MESVDAKGQPLSYSLDDSPLRRRRTRRRLLIGFVAVLLGAIAVIAARHRELIASRWELLQWERQLRGYVAPADRVVYETDPKEFDRLLASDPHYRKPRLSEYVYYVPDVWRLHPAARWNPGPGFLHERRSPGGNVRIVGMDLSDFEGFQMYPRVIRPTGLTKPGSAIKSRTALGLGGGTVHPIRVFAGQPDPADASHFTIDLQVNGIRGTVDGWLQDDDTVRLTPPAGWVGLPQRHMSGPSWCPPGVASVEPEAAGGPTISPDSKGPSR